MIPLAGGVTSLCTDASMVDCFPALKMSWSMYLLSASRCHAAFSDLANVWSHDIVRPVSDAENTLPFPFLLS